METIALLSVPIPVMEHSVMERVVVQNHHVIMSMDAASMHQTLLVWKEIYAFLPLWNSILISKTDIGAKEYMYQSSCISLRKKSSI